MANEKRLFDGKYPAIKKHFNKRLIDANALLDKFWEPECRTQTRRDFCAMVNYAPTVDPVHAAGGCYCRECEFKSEYGYCHRPEAKGLMPKVQDNGFCSYGERRTDNA